MDRNTINQSRFEISTHSKYYETEGVFVKQNCILDIGFEKIHVNREDQTTFGAPRSYSAVPNPVTYALHNYANNIHEYNKVLEELSQSKR